MSKIDYKEAIKKELKELRSLGYKRRQLELKFGYRRNYIDQALSRGGNKMLFTKLHLFATQLWRAKMDEIYGTEKEQDKLLKLEATVYTLVDAVVQLQSIVYKTPLEQAAKNLQAVIDEKLAWLNNDPTAPHTGYPYSGTGLP